MGITIFSTNSIENTFRFGFFLILALIFGISGYRTMMNPHLCYLKPQTYLDFDEPSISKRCAIIASLMVVLPFISMACADAWLHFYKVSQYGDRFYLHYPFPRRAIELIGNDKLEIDIQYELRGNYRITLIKDNRNSYSSQIMDKQDAIDSLAKMDEVLKPYRNSKIRKR